MERSILFKTIKIGSVALKNRFVMPAMNSHTTENNCYGERGVAYYTEHAKGGFGLIITEFMAVDENGLGSLSEPAIWDDKFIPSLKVLTESIHKAGGCIFSQLHHAGYGSKSHNPDFIPRAVSETIDMNDNVVRAFTIEEIHRIVKKFIEAAKRAKKAGFDGAEIHGAHGYLISQFLSAKYNRRLDEYGGNYENRFRIAREIIEGIKRECGKEFALSFRINSVDGEDLEDNKLKDNSIYAEMAEDAGADAIHVSFGSPVATYFCDTGFNIENARCIKRNLHIPVIAVGRINDENIAKWAVASGAADLIALGRQSICDPHFPQKLYAGKSNLIFRCLGCMQRCSPDIGCEPSDVGVSCMINPFTGKELRWKWNAAKVPKKIAIVGGGCSGLQSAWILAARGHQVTVYEKQARVGGNLIAASAPSGKYGFLQTIYTQEQHCREYGADIELNAEITKGCIDSLDADIVIIATGSRPFVPDITGLSGKLTAEDILMQRKALRNQRVAILGGGAVGVETAEYLLQYGNRIDVIEMKEEIAADLVPSVRNDLMERLDGKVRFYTNTALQSVDENNNLHVKQKDVLSLLQGYDEIVVAMGYRSDNPFADLAAEKKFIVIGDAKKAGTAKTAIYEATKLAISL